MFGLRSQTHGLIYYYYYFGGCLGTQVLDSMLLVGPFQLGYFIFLCSMIPHVHGRSNTDKGHQPSAPDLTLRLTQPSGLEEESGTRDHNTISIRRNSTLTSEIPHRKSLADC